MDYTNAILDGDSNHELLISPQSESECSEDEEDERKSTSDEHSGDDETLLRNNTSLTSFNPFANLNALTGQPGFLSATPLPTFPYEAPPSGKMNGEAPPDYKE